jgi:hypothetical protein
LPDLQFSANDANGGVKRPEPGLVPRRQIGGVEGFGLYSHGICFGLPPMGQGSASGARMMPLFCRDQPWYRITISAKEA